MTTPSTRSGCSRVMPSRCSAIELNAITLGMFGSQAAMTTGCAFEARSSTCRSGNSPNDIRMGCRGGDIDQRRSPGRKMQKVRVRVDQPRQDGRAVHVPALDRSAAATAQVGLGADRGNSPTLDQDGAGGRIGIIERINFRVVN